MFQAINTKDAPQPIGAYSQATRTGNLVFLSGQIPLKADGELLVDDSIEEKIAQIFRNLNAVAVASGGSIQHIVKLTVYLTDLDLFATVNKVMSDFFNAPYPARAAVEVSRLPKDVSVEVEGIMILGDG